MDHTGEQDFGRSVEDFRQDGYDGHIDIVRLTMIDDYRCAIQCVFSPASFVEDLFDGCCARQQLFEG